MSEREAFERQYQDSGFGSQRRYPNESLIGFLAGNYFRIPLEKRKSLRVLELGCGSGANLWLIAKEGFDTYGIDFAPTGITFCKDMLASWQVEAKLEVADMTQLPFEADYFDAIVDVVSMQHLNYQQHKLAYSEVNRTLKPGGKFFSYHLGENSISGRTAQSYIDHCTVADIAPGYPLAGNGPTCFLAGNEARKLMGNAGLINCNVEKQQRSYANQTQWIEYLIIQGEKVG
ncbi:MAG: class I SAM-dependent methyltransferase [Algicola sp.]|nr:class I SAM-dependent methyltransferase [Algicola sp.]